MYTYRLVLTLLVIELTAFAIKPVHDASDHLRPASMKWEEWITTPAYIKSQHPACDDPMMQKALRQCGLGNLSWHRNGSQGIFECECTGSGEAPVIQNSAPQSKFEIVEGNTLTCDAFSTAEFTELFAKKFPGQPLPKTRKNFAVPDWAIQTRDFPGRGFPPRITPKECIGKPRARYSIFETGIDIKCWRDNGKKIDSLELTVLCNCPDGRRIHSPDDAPCTVGR